MSASPAPKPPNHYGWTAERRQAARERALQHKPWEHSTGPRTDTGKARVAQNARKYHIHAREIQRLSKEMLDLNEAFIKRFRAIMKLEYGHIFVRRVRPSRSKNKLIKDVLKQGVATPPPKIFKNKLINSLRHVNSPHPRSLSLRERDVAGLTKNKASRSWVREKE